MLRFVVTSIVPNLRMPVAQCEHIGPQNGPLSVFLMVAGHYRPKRTASRNWQGLPGFAEPRHCVVDRAGHS